jgi:hypothetical protein
MIHRVLQLTRARVERILDARRGFGARAWRPGLKAGNRRKGGFFMPARCAPLWAGRREARESLPVLQLVRQPVGSAHPTKEHHHGEEKNRGNTRA